MLLIVSKNGCERERERERDRDRERERSGEIIGKPRDLYKKNGPRWT